MAEATAAYSLPISLSHQFTSRNDPPTFSMDDFEGNLLFGCWKMELGCQDNGSAVNYQQSLEAGKLLEIVPQWKLYRT